MIKILSYGGGLDSFAMLLDAIRRGELPDVAIFVDVADGSPDRDPQDPGEWPGTYRHIRETVMPLCAKLGIGFVWLTSEDYPIRDARSLFSWLWARKQIPVSGPNRLCTTIAKVERFERWAKDTYGGQELEVWIGFDAAELDRVANDPNQGKRGRKAIAWRRNRFPLVEQGLCRCRCQELVEAAGYPVPRKSACTFCCYATKADFRTLRAELPETFALVAELEERKPMTQAKPATAKRKAKIAKKLSIKNFKTLRDEVTGEEIGFTHQPLPIYVDARSPRKKDKPCIVCGRVGVATKATGCGYLSEEGRVA
jgi:hypothetical protein